MKCWMHDFNIIKLIKKLKSFTNMRLGYKTWFAFIVVAFCFVYMLRQKLSEKASVLDHNTLLQPQNDDEVKAQTIDDVEKHGGERLYKIKQNCGDVCRTDQKNSIDLKNINRTLGRCTYLRIIINQKFSKY